LKNGSLKVIADLIFIIEKISKSMNKFFFGIPLLVLIFPFIPQVFAEYEDTIVLLETNSGRILIEFFPDDAPNHVKNFITLAQDGFYTDTLFHRIIEGFMIQGGDPKTKTIGVDQNEWGTGDPGYQIDAEFNAIEHKRGIVSMARSPDPDSAGSQFFIVHKDSNFLDGQYTVFGRIITDESFTTLDNIATSATGERDRPMNGSLVTITNVQILERSELENLSEFVEPESFDVAPIATPTDKKHTFNELGLTFIAPAGWLVQTPPVTSSTSPQVAVVGPKTSESAPAVSFRIDKSPILTLDDNIQNLREAIAPLVEANVLTINSEQMIDVNERKGYLIQATGHFENQDGIEQRIGFASLLIKEKDLIYTIQYTNSLESFNPQKTYFTNVIDSLELFTPQPLTTGLDYGEQIMEGTDAASLENTSNETMDNEEGGGCLIATAAYGSEMAPQVQFLREIRDSKVMTTQSGTAFMTGFNQFYYSFSPAVADYERENPVFKEAVKVTLTPMLTSLTLLNYVDVDSEQEILGYGIGIILLNIGMYFVAPAAAIIAIKNRIKRQ